MNRAHRCLFLMIAVILAAGVVSAQVQTGTPPFGSFAGGPDVINLANLNSHITIPGLHKAGRGMNFTYDLSYDTSLWYPVGASGYQSWQPVNNWGWHGQTEIATGYVSYDTAVTAFCYDSYGTEWDYQLQYSNWVYHDSFGIPHPFNGTTQVTARVPCYQGSTGVTSFSAVATDGSGYTLNARANGVTGLYSRAGKVLSPPLNSSSGSGTATDPNGNQISVNSSGVFTDTLGTTALTIAGVAPTSTTFTYTAPSGAPAAFTMSYRTYTVQTNFGCSGISDYGPTPNVSLVDRITLPDGSFYQFTYEATPGFAGNVTGRLASVTLPTGGTITYTYTGGSSGHITCSDGSASGLTRQTPDGTWAYARTPGTGAGYTTTVIDPQNNQSVIQFQGIYETQRQVYQGSSSSGTLLQTIITCYNGNATNCNTTAITLPITQKTVTVQLPGGLQSKTNSLYNSYGLATEVDEYGYSSGSPGNLIRITLVTFASLGNYLNSNTQTITVQDAGGNTASQTTYTYDQSTPTATSGTPQHIAVSGARGNPTTISYLVQGATSLTRHFTYYDTGTPQTATDVNGATNTYAYGTGSCGNSFVTGMSLPLNLSRSLAWNCTGGALTSVTDENGQPTTAAYADLYFWRPASVTDPANAVMNLSYPSAVASEASLVFNSNSSTADLRTNLDGLGRAHVAQRKQSPSSSNYDSVETDYDNLGRPNRVTLPYSGTAGQTNPSAPATTATYDSLNRPTQITDSGGRTASYAYTQNDVLLTIGPAPTGENAKRRQFEYDALGRLTSVCEITSATASGPCGQIVPATGYWTKYTYDLLGNLTGVTQNAQSGTPPPTPQTRTYRYDLLGRLTSEQNPESGATAYVYDSDSACGTTSYPGDLVKRTDAVGNVTCYAYDLLHRNTSITYPSGSYASVTPNKYFVYDSATVNSQTMANAKTRLAEAYTAPSQTGTKLTDIGFSYSTRGEVTDIYQFTAHSGGYFHLNATYWANRALNQLSGLPGLPTWTYSVDGEGRPNSVSASGSGQQNPVTSTTYNVAGQPTQLNLGSGDSDAFSYDPNTGRMTQYKYNVNGQSVVGNLNWNPNGTLGGLAITDPFNAADTQNCSQAYDDLTRLVSANCGAIWSQTFSYDPFGNINKSGSSSFQPTYSSATNRMTSLPGFTPSYDANGNVLNDNSHIYTWDAESRPVTIDGVGLTYDAFGRVVEQNGSSGYTLVFYDPTGRKLALMSSSPLILQKAFVALPGRATAVYTASGLSYYRHPDWLGSARFGSTPGRGMYSDTAFAPFGETYAQSGGADLSFTGQNQDTVGGLYDFPAREYSTQGRWPSPDPGGLTVVDLGNPQSLNRYAYVMNNPLNLVDPMGMEPACLWDDGTWDDTPENGGATAEECRAQGGSWEEIPGPGNTTVIVNGGSSGGYGTGLPAGGCAFFYVDGIYLGSSCDGVFVPSLTSEDRAQVTLSLAGAQATHDLGCVGLGGAVAGGSIAASAPVIPKPFSAGGTSGTSVASTLLRGANIGQSLPTPVGMPGTSSFAWRATADLGVFVSRWLPYAGTAYGAYKLNQCLSSTPTGK